MNCLVTVCVALFILSLAAAHTSYQSSRGCQNVCRYGIFPGTCNCRPGPQIGGGQRRFDRFGLIGRNNGGLNRRMDTCMMVKCSRFQRCVEVFGQTRCVPRSDTTYPIQGLHLGAPTCEQPAMPGNCEAYMSRFFFNRQTQMCERFIYGGCGGNSNNFETYRECRATCMRRSNRTY